MSRKLRKAEQEQAVQAYIAYCKKNREVKNDKGAMGKIADVLGREYVTKRLRSDDVKARSAGKADCTFKGKDGKMHSIEFKTGCGALAYEYDDEFIDVDRLLPGVEYFAYNPEYCDNMQVQDQFFVTTREDFLNLLINYSEKKPMTWFKRNKAYRQVNIQEFNTSNKKYDYLTNALYDWPTLELFVAEQKG
jgi:hypothetical protein